MTESDKKPVDWIRLATIGFTLISAALAVGETYQSVQDLRVSHEELTGKVAKMDDRLRQLELSIARIETKLNDEKPH